MKGPELLESYEDNWKTEMGAWFPGERVVLRGEDLLSSFKSSSWMEMVLFAVTGKRSPELAQLIDSIWVLSTSFPDPRLWNNRVAALAGTTRSTGVLGLAAGVAVSEATIYGLKPIKGASDFLFRTKKGLDSGSDLEEIVALELKTYRAAYGYGRPLVSNDERILPVIKMAENLGFGDGDFLKLANEIEHILNKKCKMKMNIAAVYAALMADAGLSVSDTYYMACLSFSGGMFGPYLDALEKPSGAFFPLCTERVSYVGEGDRQWKS